MCVLLGGGLLAGRLCDMRDPCMHGCHSPCCLRQTPHKGVGELRRACTVHNAAGRTAAAAAGTARTPSCRMRQRGSTPRSSPAWRWRRARTAASTSRCGGRGGAALGAAGMCAGCSRVRRAMCGRAARDGRGRNGARCCAVGRHTRCVRCVWQGWACAACPGCQVDGAARAAAALAGFAARFWQ